MNLGKIHHDLTLRSSPGIMVNKGNHPQMALIQVSEILQFTQINGEIMVDALW